MSSLAFPSTVQFAGHETFPLRQLWLRKAYVAADEFEAAESDAKNVFAEDSAIRRFGVGKNMVSSIRHWALACDVLVEGSGSSIELGPVGKFLFGDKGVDPYLERPATAWLVHWLLAGRAKRSTTWFWLFNRVTQATFSRASLLPALQQYAASRTARAAPVTLRRDLEVCVRCYLTKVSGRDVDDAAEPLLADLGLLIEGPGEVLQFRRGAQPSLPAGVFAFALLDYWELWEKASGSGQMTFSFEALAHDYGSPGRTFKLDEDSVAERIMGLEDQTQGALKWSDSAGIRQVSRDPKTELHKLKQKVLRSAYGR